MNMSLRRKWLMAAPIICLSVGAFAGLSCKVAVACTTPNKSARVISLAPVDWAPAKELELGPWTLRAKVTIDANGHVIGVQLPKSSGDKRFDQAVMQAARQSTYTPQIKACKAITGMLLVMFIWRED